MSIAGGLLSRSVFRDAVGAAVRAPSMYNAQPWRFRLHPDSIEVSVDAAQRLPIADPDDWAARIALGAAVTNMRLALTVAGCASTVVIRTADDTARAIIQLTGECVASPADRRLFDAIVRRRSHRDPFEFVSVPVDARAHLADAAQAAGCWLELVDDREQISRVAAIIRTADSNLRANEEYTIEMRRWTGRGANDAAGITLDAAGLAPEGQDLLAMRDFGGRTRASGRDYEPDPLLAVLGTIGGTPYDDVVAGAALQVVLLTATADRLATSMLSQPMEVRSARDELRGALSHYGTPQMLIRVGYGDPGPLTARRSINEVIDY